MNQERIREFLGRFSEARVLVVGDIYLDENVFGTVTGISLEAPVPIYEVHERRFNPGAAGNAACNVAALGATTYMIGYVGDDTNADIVRREFAQRNVDTSGLVVDPDTPTNTYGKLRAGSFNAPSQEVLRTDTPTPTFVTDKVEDAIIANIQVRAPLVDAIVVTDQVASVATEKVLAAVVECAKDHDLITVGDSRSRAGEFKDFTVVVPNDREAGIGTDIDVVDEPSLMRAGDALRKICKNALVTRGPEGITVFAEDGSINTVPITPCAVIDVTGAGDTVTAAATVSLVAGGTLVEAATVGNAAAGIAVSQSGVVTVPHADLLERMTTEQRPTKERSLDELKAIFETARNEGKTVVWTNGCFDILHVGHITYLQRAASLGDILVVGLNSDKSVQEVKGPDRPIIPEHDRAFVMAELESVDYVTVFSDPTPLSVLDALKPDIYAKGGDYTMDTIDQEERHLVEGYGGRIHLIPGVEGQSTSYIIGRIHEENLK
jgi:D-beta-D-heptose 7-phosphate kinase/D-beta-D-heptose 1-phosphate adenosyltransferase